MQTLLVLDDIEFKQRDHRHDLIEDRTRRSVASLEDIDLFYLFDPENRMYWFYFQKYYCATRKPERQVCLLSRGVPKGFV